MNRETAPKVSLIVARAQNGVIGLNNCMPWHLPEDLKHFKAMTMGKAVIMGRKTWDSILARLGKPLPGRTSIVLTRQGGFNALGAIPADAPRAALDKAFQASPEEVWVIGGAEIYREYQPVATDAHVTEILQNFDGDAFFSPLDPKVWREVSREPGVSAQGLAHDFVHYQRI